jgi:hypothetical protein
MTDWEERLRKRAEDVKAAQRARDLDIAAAHAAGLAWRAIGEAANVNHETARKTGIRIAAEPHPAASPPP